LGPHPHTLACEVQSQIRRGPASSTSVLDRISYALTKPLFCSYHCEIQLRRAANSVIVDVDTIWKIYQTGSVKVEALRGVNLAVKRGEMIAVMGPSGCGKTTLLNCVSGLDELSKGRVSVEGTDLARMSDDQKSE